MITGGRRSGTLRRGGVVAALVLLTACTGDGGQADESPSPLFPSADESAPPEPSPSPSEPSPTPSPSETAQPSPDDSASDPFAVPDEITPEYVERVLNEINRQTGEITREILRRPVDPDAGRLPEDLLTQLTSLYADPILEINRTSFIGLLAFPEAREGLRPPDEYGQIRDDVEEVVLESGRCIAARIDSDFAQTDAEISGAESTLAIVFLVEDADANVTGWRVARQLGVDAAPGSAEEDELRDVDPSVVAEQLPAVCS